MPTDRDELKAIRKRAEAYEQSIGLLTWNTVADDRAFMLDAYDRSRQCESRLRTSLDRAARQVVQLKSQAGSA